MSRYLYFLIIIMNISALTRTDTLRYLDTVSSSIVVKSDIVYGKSVGLKGDTQKLMMDLYVPSCNGVVIKHPLIIFIHGGGFKSNDKVGKMSTTWLTGFAKQGYVCASINYRLGIASPENETFKFEALYRGVQDAKAAVRFFYKNASVYGVDTSQIFVMGTSAGSMIAIHMAYMEPADVPSYIDTVKWGSLEGNSGNQGYSSKVHGVINCWGAIGDLKWIKKGCPPILNIHGTDDKSVPYNYSETHKPLPYGSLSIYNRANQVGVKTAMRTFYNTGHTLDNNTAKLDSAFNEMTTWLAAIIKLASKSKSRDQGLYESRNINSDPCSLLINTSFDFISSRERLYQSYSFTHN